MNKSAGREATFGFVLAIVVLFVSGWVSYRNIRRISRNDAVVVHTHQVLDEVRDILAGLFQAESRQRSYLITCEQLYLQPYRAAAAAGAGSVALQQLTRDNPSQQERVTRLQPVIDARLGSLRSGVEVSDAEDLERCAPIRPRGPGQAGDGIDSRYPDLRADGGSPSAVMGRSMILRAAGRAVSSRT